jgi:serine/threonine-protein kinase PknG
MLGILSAAQAIHDKGVVFRDFKPENVMLSGITPKVIDFGSAIEKAAQDPKSSARILGTTFYKAPELFAETGAFYTEASDIYALGVLLYAGVSGKHFDEVKFHSLDDEGKFLYLKTDSHYRISNLMARIVIQATHFDVEKRFSSAQDFKIAMWEFLIQTLAR